MGSSFLKFVFVFGLLLTFTACNSTEKIKQELEFKGIPFTEQGFQDSASNGDVEAVKLFIKSGMGKQKDKNWASAYDKALFAAVNSPNNLEVIKMLVNEGASVNITVGKSTLLMFAFDAETIKYLLSMGVDAKKNDEKGFGPIFNATNLNDVELAKLLIEKGADINAVRVGKKTALMDMVLSDQPAMAKLLVDNGANIDAQDESGKTAMEYAKMKHLSWAVDLLQKASEKMACK